MGHTDFSYSLNCGVHVCSLPGNNFSIFATNVLLSIFWITKSNADFLSKQNGLIFSPSKSTSRFNVTNCREIYAAFLLSINKLRILSFFTEFTFAYKLSNELNSLINSAAFLGPMPGTPGTLSVESPIND